MGNETIFYYVTEETATGHKKEIETCPWKRMRLFTYRAETDEMILITALIPHLQKGWKKEKLYKLMRKALEKAADAYPYDTERAEIILQPQVQEMLMQTETFPPIFWRLAEKLLGACREKSMETVILMLGETLFPEEQMRRFFDMMQPYLPRINHMTILYGIEKKQKRQKKNAEAADSRGEEEYSEAIDFRGKGGHSEDPVFREEEDRLEETLSEYTEELYYEYGLVVQLMRADACPKDLGRGPGKTGGILFLDYGYAGDIPLRALRAGDIYLDVFSSRQKEMLFGRKCTEVSYLSPGKYLDTMVKSEYDRLVNEVRNKKIEARQGETVRVGKGELRWKRKRTY